MKLLWFIFYLYTSMNAIQLNINSIDDILVNSFSNVKSKSATILKPSLNPNSLQEFYQIWDQLESKIISKFQAYEDRLLPESQADNPPFDKDRKMKQEIISQLLSMIQDWIVTSMIPFLIRNHVPKETLDQWKQFLEFASNAKNTPEFRLYKRMKPASVESRIFIQDFLKLDSKIAKKYTSSVKKNSQKSMMIKYQSLLGIGKERERKKNQLPKASVEENVPVEIVIEEWGRFGRELHSSIFAVKHPDGSIGILYKQPEYDHALRRLKELNANYQRNALNFRFQISMIFYFICLFASFQLGRLLYLLDSRFLN